MSLILQCDRCKRQCDSEVVPRDVRQVILFDHDPLLTFAEIQEKRVERNVIARRMLCRSCLRTLSLLVYDFTAEAKAADRPRRRKT